MEIKIKIATPQGAADGFNKKSLMRIIKKLILGRKSKLLREHISPDKSIIYWVVDIPPRNLPKINRNLSMYSTMIDQIFTNKMVSKKFKKLADNPEDYDNVVDMMRSKTKIKIIHTDEWENIDFNNNYT